MSTIGSLNFEFFLLVNYKTTIKKNYGKEEFYSSKEDGPRSFMIGQDNVETGLHEAVTYLKLGDKAHVILPSHLAHGLTGDNNKIPPRSTVIYNLELIGLK